MASCLIIPLGQRQVKAPLRIVTVTAKAALFQLGNVGEIQIAQ
jgi:hypothetical protein